MTFILNTTELNLEKFIDREDIENNKDYIFSFLENNLKNLSNYNIKTRNNLIVDIVIYLYNIPNVLTFFNNFYKNFNTQEIRIVSRIETSIIYIYFTKLPNEQKFIRSIDNFYLLKSHVNNMYKYDFDLKNKIIEESSEFFAVYESSADKQLETYKIKKKGNKIWEIHSETCKIKDIKYFLSVLTDKINDDDFLTEMFIQKFKCKLTIKFSFIWYFIYILTVIQPYSEMFFFDNESNYIKDEEPTFMTDAMKTLFSSYLYFRKETIFYFLNYTYKFKLEKATYIEIFCERKNGLFSQIEYLFFIYVFNSIAQILTKVYDNVNSELEKININISIGKKATKQRLENLNFYNPEMFSGAYSKQCQFNKQPYIVDRKKFKMFNAYVDSYLTEYKSKSKGPSKSSFFIKHTTIDNEEYIYACIPPLYTKLAMLKFDIFDFEI